MKPRSRRWRWLVVSVGLLAEPVLLKARGLPIGGNLVVRCREGHLFTTIWVPSASVKALRLGWLRFQWCPVGHHWSLVTPVRDGELTPKEQGRAHSQHDLWLP
jgi:hypothetical protein